MYLVFIPFLKEGCGNNKVQRRATEMIQVLENKHY